MMLYLLCTFSTNHGHGALSWISTTFSDTKTQTDGRKHTKKKKNLLTPTFRRRGREKDLTHHGHGGSLVNLKVAQHFRHALRGCLGLQRANFTWRDGPRHGAACEGWENGVYGLIIKKYIYIKIYKTYIKKIPSFCDPDLPSGVVRLAFIEPCSAICERWKGKKRVHGETEKKKY